MDDLTYFCVESSVLTMKGVKDESYRLVEPCRENMWERN